MPTHPRPALILLLLATLACSVLTTPTPSAPAPAGTASPKAVASSTVPPAASSTPAPSNTQAAADTPAAADSPTPADSPAPGNTPAPTDTPPPLATRAATASVDGIKLSTSGPWLVFSAADGIWAVNADGNGLTQLMPAAPYFRLGPAAPQGGHVSVVTASDAQGYHDLTLWVLSLPGGDAHKVTALTNASTEPGADAPGDLLDVLTPLGEAAWSPDGQTLAFIGAQAGPSADLFTYGLAAGQVTRLTDGASQAFGPSWSPDGKYVVQLGASTFGSGAGYSMDGVWAAAADNSGVALLYKPDSGGEDLDGWPGPETFVVNSFQAQCSTGNLRTFNIAAGQSQGIFPGFYTRAAVDPASGAALVAVDEFVAACTPGAAQGLFLAQPGLPPKLLNAKGGIDTHLGWSAQGGLFYAFTDAGWAAYTPTGQPASLPDVLNGEPLVAPGRKIWAWTDLGDNSLWVSNGAASAQKVFAGAAILPTWSPDGQTLLFFGDNQLFAASGPDLRSHAMGAQLQLGPSDTREWVP